MTNLIRILSLIILIIAAILLITGSSLLSVALLQDPYLPLGNLIAWAGLIALPVFIYYGTITYSNSVNRFRQSLGRVLRIMIIASILWYPVCWFLAGNPAFSFTGSSGIWIGNEFLLNTFWTYNIVLVAVPIIVLLVYGVHSILTRN